MKRREFIKNTTLTACGACLFLNQKNKAEAFFEDPIVRKLKKLGLWEEEIYKSKADLPKKIRLEACSLCQLRCPKCAMRDPECVKNCGFGYLKFKDFKNVVDDNPQLKVIELSHLGEIFLNPELLDILKYAHEKNIILIYFK